MPDNSLKIQPNPTRLDQPIDPKPVAVNRLVDDPEFVPSALASEEDAVRGFVKANASAPARVEHPVDFDKRLRPWGSAAIAVWAGTLLGVAIARQYARRKHSAAAPVYS